MLYHLFKYLEEQFNLPGAGLFDFISFRAALSLIVALFISSVYGKKIIAFLQKKQIGETIRDLGLEGQYSKKGTPTMGGLIIIGSIVIPTLLFANLTNVYVILMLITTIWLGFIGFLDDYIKVFKKNKEGLQGRFKVVGQVVLGIVVGITLYVSPQVVVSKKFTLDENGQKTEVSINTRNAQHSYVVENLKTTETTIPFVKDNEFDYAVLVEFLGEDLAWMKWIVFALVIIFIVTAISNGANLTDGLDGLAAGTSSIIGATLGVLAYVSGNYIFADYLNIMYIPYSSELVIFISAFIGATVGFLWYNSFPAQVFMGDTGSLTIGGIIAVFAIVIRKELLIPILCGIFIVENFSVVLQVFWFKYTRKRFGEGRRIFKMAPLHHHFQKLGYTEPKIVTRFWIVGIFLAVITIITLKIR